MPKFTTLLVLCFSGTVYATAPDSVHGTVSFFFDDHTKPTIIDCSPGISTTGARIKMSNGNGAADGDPRTPVNLTFNVKLADADAHSLQSELNDCPRIKAFSLDMVRVAEIGLPKHERVSATEHERASTTDAEVTQFSLEGDATNRTARVTITCQHLEFSNSGWQRSEAK